LRRNNFIGFIFVRCPIRIHASVRSESSARMATPFNGTLRERCQWTAAYVLSVLVCRCVLRPTGMFATEHSRIGRISTHLVRRVCCGRASYTTAHQRVRMNSYEDHPGIRGMIRPRPRERSDRLHAVTIPHVCERANATDQMRMCERGCACTQSTCCRQDRKCWSYTSAACMDDAVPPRMDASVDSCSRMRWTAPSNEDGCFIRTRSCAWTFAEMVLACVTSQKHMTTYVPERR
jgi:hypothetical protein